MPQDEQRPRPSPARDVDLKVVLETDPHQLPKKGFRPRGPAIRGLSLIPLRPYTRKKWRIRADFSRPWQGTFRSYCISETAD